MRSVVHLVAMGSHICSELRGLGDCQNTPGMKQGEEGLSPEITFLRQELCHERCLMSRYDRESMNQGCTDPSILPCRAFPPATLLEDIFELTRPTFQDPPSTCLAVHRATGATRRLVQVLKPTGAEEQQRVRMFIKTLQGLRSDSVAQVLDVFEDWRATSLIMEHCAGGSIYDRILKLPRLSTPSPYFAEQESAVIVRHALQSLHALHQKGLSHGHPTPESFHFESGKAHAKMKLVDFGLEYKVQAWDSSDLSGCRGPFDRGRAACLQFYEPCRIVFFAPEVVLPQQVGHRPSFQACGQDCTVTSSAAVATVAANAAMNGDSHLDLLSEVIDSHLDSLDSADARTLQAADSWSVGAITFILLCGYPPFFAPCRDTVLARIERTDYAFDPPFWSKVSEDAKDFVQNCLRSEIAERITVAEALRHPWIQSLAESSPPGPMLPSFALNLRRFVRTALIEKTAANALACSLSFDELQEFCSRCRQLDTKASGYFTATELRQVLERLGHVEVAEHIAVCFSRALRHPGESFIDYVTLVQSVRARRDRILEEDLWKCFCEFTSAPDPCGDSFWEEAQASMVAGNIPLPELSRFLEGSDVRSIMLDHGVKDIHTLAESITLAVRPGEDGLLEVESARSQMDVDFLDVSVEVMRHLPMIVVDGSGGSSQPSALTGDDSMSASPFRSTSRSAERSRNYVTGDGGSGAPVAAHTYSRAERGDAGGCVDGSDGSSRSRGAETGRAAVPPGRPHGWNGGVSLKPMCAQEAPPSPMSANTA